MAVPAQASNPYTSCHVQGNVDLATGVAVAPGVLLGAAPGCRLVISFGVCLGADVVVQARQGDLVLEPGVSLGSGVLIVGHGSIGQHTCIGANSTVINPALAAYQVVAPGSLVGDPSRPLSAQGLQPSRSAQEAKGHSVNGVESTVQNGGVPGEHFSPGSSSKVSSQTRNGSSVYGKTQINQLLLTLFPHRQALNGASPEDRP